MCHQEAEMRGEGTSFAACRVYVEGVHVYCHLRPASS